MIKQILNKINEYNDIVIYRHINPDFDAFGSQLGMYELIKTTYPDKNVYIAGDFKSDLFDKFDFNYQNISCSFHQPALGIVLDTANKERIDDQSYLQCQELIKIDHHIVVDSYGSINYEDPSASSCSQLVCELLKDRQTDISKKGAEALYMGIVGDTNRFMYSSTDERTFEVASLLLKKGIDLQKLYDRMYLSSLNDLYVKKFILNHFVIDGHIAYYILKDEDLKILNITREQGSNYIHTLGSIKEFDVWMAITENTKDNNWRVSLRSRYVPVNKVANLYRGGGHKYAAGATLLSLDELPGLLNDIKEVSHE